MRRLVTAVTVLIFALLHLIALLLRHYNQRDALQRTGQLPFNRSYIR